MSPKVGRLVMQCSIHLATHQIICHMVTVSTYYVSNTALGLENTVLRKLVKSPCPIGVLIMTIMVNRKRGYCLGEMILFLDILALRYNFFNKNS